MAQPVTSNTIANRAIALIGNNISPVTGQAPNFDSSAAGNALKIVYAGAVATVANQFGWDQARNTVALALSGNPAPFGFEYHYPENGIEVWQLAPGVIADKNNPLPVNWNVANAQVGGVQTKVIHTDLAGAVAIYNNNPTESPWTPIFQEVGVRVLAREGGTV